MEEADRIRDLALRASEKAGLKCGSQDMHGGQLVAKGKAFSHDETNPYLVAHATEHLLLSQYTRKGREAFALSYKDKSMFTMFIMSRGEPSLAEIQVNEIVARINNLASESTK